MALLSGIVSWSLRHRALVLLATGLLVIVGVRSAIDLPIDAVPDITNVQVQVITPAPALSPTEVEQYVSVPVERAMSGIPKVEEVRSISKYGLSVVTVVFDEGTDIYFARQMVLERMRAAEEAVPSAYGRPEMGPIATGLGEVYQFVLRGEGHSLMELEETLDWYIGPQLRDGPGRRGGEQLRRRGQAVPGRDRPEAPPGRWPLGRARCSERSSARTRTRAAGTSSTTGSRSSSARSVW